MANAEVGYRRYEGGQDGESHSPFLTDRESAELTAVATLGPLALIAFDTEAKPGIGQPHETQASIEQPDVEVPDTIDGFTRVELLETMRHQHNLAGAAIMFAAESHLN